MANTHRTVPIHQLAQLRRRLSACLDLQHALTTALDAALELHETHLGNIQLYRAGALLIAAQRGFEAPFLEAFRRVSVDDDTACARAMREGRSLIIRDIELDREFAPFRAIAAEAGFRAVQSTPMVGSNGLFAGMISTHFAEPHTPSEQQMLVLDFLAEEVADTIHKFHTEDLFSADTWDAPGCRQSGSR